MAEPAPRIDFANLPTPAEGILATLFITVRKVARSRDFYSRVLGGTVVLDDGTRGMVPEEWLRRYARIAAFGEAKVLALALAYYVFRGSSLDVAPVTSTSRTCVSELSRGRHIDPPL